MSDQGQAQGAEARAIMQDWLGSFAAAVQARDSAAAASQFLPDGYWKDILAFTWEHRYFSGRAEIADALERAMPKVAPSNFRISANRTAPRLARRAKREVVEGFFDFDTAAGSCSAFARIELPKDKGGDAKAWIVLTTLQALTGFEETVGERRPSGDEFAKNALGRSWLDDVEERLAYDNRSPEVVVIGAGQAGLSVAARLSQMDADVLVVEQNARVGDVWRDRYRSLTLHNEMMANHLPYMPYPDSWPVWLTKDHLAIWLEAYASAMALNVWTSTSVEGANWSEADKQWTLTLDRDGTTQKIKAHHVIMATGVSGSIPNYGTLPGLEDFEGDILHSATFKNGANHRGKNAMIVGTGNSAHDVAQDLYMKGAGSVSILQRGPTCVVSLQPSAEMIYKIYSSGDPLEDVDLMAASVPYPVLVDSYRSISEKAARIDADMLEALNARGLRTHFGEDGTGFQMMFMRGKGGYYIDVGCADLIADGKIDIVQHSDMDKLEAKGMRMKDGSFIPLDLLIMATGFKNMQENIRGIFGDTVAEKVGPVWGFDKHHQMRAMWRRTGQEGFWITGGSLLDSRIFSRFLAIEIKAALLGVLPAPDEVPLADRMVTAG